MPGARCVLAAGGERAQRLRERPRAVPARRVHDDAGGLVDHEQMLVAVGNRVRRVGYVGRRRLLGLVDGDQLAGAQPMALGRRPAVDQHVAGLDEALRARPASPAAPPGRRRAGRPRPQASLAAAWRGRSVT